MNDHEQSLLDELADLPRPPTAAKLQRDLDGLRAQARKLTNERVELAGWLAETSDGSNPVAERRLQREMQENQKSLAGNARLVIELLRKARRAGLKLS